MKIILMSLEKKGESNQKKGTGATDSTALHSSAAEY